MRSNHQQRVNARRLLETLPSITNSGCCHWQCGCGCFSMVSFKGRIYCQACGRLRYASIKSGTIYYTADDIVKCEYCQARSQYGVIKIRREHGIP